VTEQAIRDYLSQLGKKGAEAANKNMTAAQRKKRARRAAQARWAKKKPK
jgi:hypothetical protein